MLRESKVKLLKIMIFTECLCIVQYVLFVHNVCIAKITPEKIRYDTEFHGLFENKLNTLNKILSKIQNKAKLVVVK